MPMPAVGDARISRLKNTFGMQRSPYHGRSGADRCIGRAAIGNKLAARRIPTFSPQGKEGIVREQARVPVDGLALC
jgi:hypothetical protein